MPLKESFARLDQNQVQALLESSGEVLRYNYVNILTLLQDLLGKYSSTGNATVFLDPKERDHLVYQFLETIRIFIPEKTGTKVITVHDHKNRQRSIRYDINSALDPTVMLAIIVRDHAVTNIANANKLKSLCENSETSSIVVTKAIDDFLDDLISEYELLRKPFSSGSMPPQADRRRDRSQARKLGNLKR